MAMRVGGSNPRYVQSDQHGTGQVTATIPGFAVTRRAFDPYGNPIGAGQGLWPDNRGFLNMPHNPVTGLTDIGARKYDLATGTFVSVDPILDTNNPQQWNPYAYSNNNPVTYSDPSGLYCDSCNFYSNDNSSLEVGIGCPPCSSSPKKNKKNNKINSGSGKDPAKQFPDLGRRIPTFDELKQRPGFARYMESGTYEEAIADWAKNICRRQTEGDEEFCNAAHSYGLLEEDQSMRGIVLIALAGLVLAPLVIECFASTLCVAIVGGAADATAPEGAAFAGALVLQRHLLGW